MSWRMNSIIGGVSRPKKSASSAIAFLPSPTGLLNVYAVSTRVPFGNAVARRSAVCSRCCSRNTKSCCFTVRSRLSLRSSRSCEGRLESFESAEFISRSRSLIRTLRLEAVRLIEVRIFARIVSICSLRRFTIELSGCALCSRSRRWRTAWL